MKYIINNDPKGPLYITEKEVKLNYNCPASEKSGEGKGSCGGGKTEKNNANDNNSSNSGKAGKFLADKELIGEVKLDDKGNLLVDARRFGSEFGDPSRGGTWYEIPAYEGAKSGYQAGWWGSKEANLGVGGSTEHTKTILTENPYFHDWTGQGEGKSVLRAANKILGPDVTAKLSRGIKGANAEKAFAKIEKAMSEKLKSMGYDSLVMYDKTGNTIHPKQIFKFL